MAIDETFFGLLRIRPGRFWLDEPVETNRLADGGILTASLGAALWRGELTLVPAAHADAQEIEARLDRLIRPGEFFRAYDWRRNGPKEDQGGFLLGAAAPVIHTLNPDNKRLRISGLPPGYVISPGDYLGADYGSNPVRNAMHRAVTGAVADGTGLTPLFEVAPHIRPGMATGTAVTLVRPSFKARLTSAKYGSGDVLITDGAQISFIQTLR